MTAIQNMFMSGGEYEHLNSHQTHSSHSGQHTRAGPSPCIQTLLPEEEVEFIIIPLGAVGDLLDLNEYGF